MSRTLFENTKAALAFAGITIVGAALMIGPGDGNGVLDRTVDRYSEARETETVGEDAPAFAEEQSVDDEGFDPDSGWGTSDEVFGDFLPEDTLPEDSDSPPQERVKAPASPVSRVVSPSPRARMPVVADNPGVLVPRPDQQARQDAPIGVPGIASRQDDD